MRAGEIIIFNEWFILSAINWVGGEDNVETLSRY